jgi:hypothetical protein
MVSLVDIVPQTRIVQIAAGDLALHGLSLRQIAHLLLRFPTLRNLMTEGAPELDVDTLLLMAPDAIGAIIAEAAGEPDAADTIPNSLGVDDIVTCLLAVRDLTMPSGPVPFFRRLMELINATGVNPSGRDQAMTSPQVPNGSLVSGIPLAK